uniref:Band 4.1 domain-containing protein n=1 Tax=Denticeps clupeoides TaxID=299321 RepID=A0AAY4CHN2_9TELE
WLFLSSYRMAAWDLSVTVEDLGPDAPPIVISVTSDLHIGRVILDVVQKTQLQRDWSDHALWWEQKQQWLLRTAWTLEKCGIHADAKLVLTPQHKPLQLGLPNGVTVRLCACFSRAVFHTVVEICKVLNIRHPEELSLLRPVEVKKKKKDKDHVQNIYDLTDVSLTSGRFFMVFVKVGFVEAAPQGVQQDDTLWLRFKYNTFYDLEPKYDAVRLTQLYEQARWAILLEDIDCTEEEMMLFGALQYHISKLAQSESQNRVSGIEDLDCALQSLELKLEGDKSGTTDMIVRDTPYFLFRATRPTALFLARPLQYFRVLGEKCTASRKGTDCPHKLPSGSDVSPDVNVAGQKFCIKLLIPAPEGMNELYLRCEDEQQYSQWMAACRLGSKGLTLADSSFQREKKSIQSFLSMQRSNSGDQSAQTSENINTFSLLSPRYQKKYKAKQLTPRILDSYQNVARLSMTEAILKFLQIWQALPDFGISYFMVRFKGSRKDEVLGIANNRLIRIDLGVGDVVKTWRYSNMRQWNVNWDIRQVAIEFDGNINMAFGCVTADCKIVHEYIGGYIFMSTRGRDRSDTLNEELFHKLTGGHEVL